MTDAGSGADREVGALSPADELGASPVPRWVGPRIAAVLIGVVTVALVAVLATRQTAAERSTVSPLIGRVAPEITGNDILTGRRVQLSSDQGRWTLVNFFGTWCPPCVREHPEIVAFSKANPDVDVLSIINEDTVENVRAFFDANGGDWPVLDNTRAAVDYGITGLPESYLVAPNGQVAVWFKGALSESRLQRALDEYRQAGSRPTASSLPPPSVGA